MSSYAELRYISQEAAEREPEHARLSFDRRTPNPATAAALRRAAKPELLAEDLAQMKAKRRPRAA
jgi:hypothetical protein